jgi:microcystin-dependent protein
LLSIASNTALFSLLGTTFGGDGRTTFGLPDLRGRVAIHPGNGPGLPLIRWGEKSGNYQVALTVNNMPSHTHTATATVHASSGQGSQEGPGGNVLAYDRRETQYSASAPDVTMNSESATVTVDNAGGSQPFNIMQPYLGFYHCIALVGIYPSRN